MKDVFSCATEEETKTLDMYVSSIRIAQWWINKQIVAGLSIDIMSFFHVDRGTFIYSVTVVSVYYVLRVVTLPVYTRACACLGLLH